MIEKAEKPVQAHIGCALEKELLQRVLEVVDTFFWVLKQCIVENLYMYASPMSLPFDAFDCGEGCPAIDEFFMSEPADFSVVR